MEQMGSWMFGCDVCQDVCPFNATSPLPTEQTVPFAPIPRRGEVSAAELRMGESEFAAFARARP